MKDETVCIADIYVPAKRRKTLNAERVEELAEDILEAGQISPIWVRQGDKRLVLVEGLHRLEALKVLGEGSIVANFVQAGKN
ncbi:MAG: ParB N-terminal domain-containing protein [Rhodospirillales bacterium]|jgi:ParB-like chromosome segregation protein Spo0J|nr:ParB N-terminal domain-containing protein [Rhodospirillales bacterium]